MLARFLSVALLAFVVYAQNNQIHLHVVNNNEKALHLDILSNQNFRPVIIKPKASLNHTFHRPLSARIFGRIDCTDVTSCRRDGLIPVTIAALTATNKNIHYDISLEEGFNTDISIEPQGVEGSGHTCTKASCTADILAVCPKELHLERGGQLVACRTACEAFRTEQYCCRGSYGTAATCDVTKWPTNYVEFFHKQCPDAYAYRFDNRNNTAFRCDNASRFVVTFGNGK